MAQVAPAPGGGGGGAGGARSSGGSSSGASSGSSKSTGSSRSTSGSSSTNNSTSRSRTTTGSNTGTGAQSGAQQSQQPGINQNQPGGGANLNQGQLRGGSQQPGTNGAQQRQPNTTQGGQTSTSTQRGDSTSQNRSPLPPANSNNANANSANANVNGTTTTGPNGTANTNANTGTTTSTQQSTTTQPRSSGSVNSQNNVNGPNNMNGQAAATAQQNSGGFGTNLVGTISNLGDTGFNFSSGVGAAPQTFLTTPDTVYVDGDNRTVARQNFPITQPATVFYTQSPNGMVATRVVAKTRTADFSTGTLTEVSPGVMVMTLPNASDTPVRYVNDKTTNYVDQNGEPVSPDTVKAGTPVKVFYTKVGDTLFASKVEVQTGASGLPRPPVADDTKGSTTTRDPNANR